MPEGSDITAQYAGRTYHWLLTYHGGPQGHDLVLKNKSEYATDAPVTHARLLPKIPKALWTEHRLYPLSTQPQGEPAFPGAEGFGAFTPGGRGGKTIYVENLNDSGPGSLREAIETSGSRTILFRVGGVIPLKSTLVIKEPFVTIDGQNAPGMGIMLRNHGIEVRTHSKGHWAALSRQSAIPAQSKLIFQFHRLATASGVMPLYLHVKHWITLAGDWLRKVNKFYWPKTSV